MYKKVITISIVVKIMIMIILITNIINPNYYEEGEKETINTD